MSADESDVDITEAVEKTAGTNDNALIRKLIILYYKYRFKGIATILTCKCLSVQVLSING